MREPLAASTKRNRIDFWAVNTSGVPFSNLLGAPLPPYAPANVLNKTSFKTGSSLTKPPKSVLLLRCER